MKGFLFRTALAAEAGYDMLNLSLECMTMDVVWECVARV